MLSRKNVGARIGYLKATLVAVETEDLQKRLGLGCPRAMWIPFPVPLTVLSKESLQVWRGEGSGGQTEVCRLIRASRSGGKVL